MPKKTIGSCTAGSLEQVRAALALQKITIEKVSGTIKGLKTEKKKK
jgi:RNase P/RNase MRP subunit POP5